MSREIKFRAWHKELEMMILPEQIIAPMLLEPNGGDAVNLISVIRYFETRQNITWTQDNSEFVELMQFTGLKDKNGKKIYEGDIIGIYEEKVVFKTTSGSVAAFNPNCPSDKEISKRHPDIIISSKESRKNLLHKYEVKWSGIAYEEGSWPYSAIHWGYYHAFPSEPNIAYKPDHYEVIGNIHENPELLS